MSDDKQEIDGGGVSAPDMSPEEIAVELAAVTAEADGGSEPQRESGDSAAGETRPSSNLSAEAANVPAGSTPATSEQDPCPDPGNAAMPEADPAAALDRIDADLAELESLLAQTASDSTSIPAGIAQAPPPSPEPREPLETTAEWDEAPEPVSTGRTEAAPAEKPEQDVPDVPPAQQESANPGGTDDALLKGGSLPEPLEAAETASRTDSQPVAETADEQTITTAVAPSDNNLLNIFLHTVSRVFVDLLILIDKPVAGLGPRCRTVVGLAAIATCLVAVVTWVAGC
ncbi:MAG: hypothetical protein QUV05_10840 [Phycisphaerae bacterium]|nr:hypothetical protein [Phycisphaerae bacterium]